MSVFSKEYCEKMRVRIDCGNMLAEAVGKHGITAEEIERVTFENGKRLYGLE